MGEEAEAEVIPKLMAMAELKWDSYEGFRAGQRFMESLARWLREFPDEETRRRWRHFFWRASFLSALQRSITSSPSPIQI